uniref:Ig-like domain-containing protein n=1 Tax=Cyprinus carpio TaxID=7962 RepID=A0A8C1ILB2_CYPCA
MDMRSLLLLSVLVALIREGEGQNLTVTLLPKFPQVFVGDDVTLICNCKGGSKPTTWIFNGASQTHEDYSKLLIAVTPKNNGVYECVQGGKRSDPYTLTVLNLEPHAQLSPSVGGAVMTKGDGRNLVLQADDDLKNWSCFVLRGVSTFSLALDVDEKMNRAVIFAELKEAERATFFCKKKKADLRSNAVTLKKTELMVMLVPPAIPALQGEPLALRCVVWGGPELEKAIFYKDKTPIQSSAEDTYTITKAKQSDNGNYSCHATYRFSHISAGAARKEGDSDAQELKVIGGPPAAVISESSNGLQCSCPDCPANCTSYHWYHTPLNDPFTRKKLSESNGLITVKDVGQYKCRKECGKGFSRFSNVYIYKDTAHLMPILLAAILIFLGLLIVLLIALKRRRGGSAIQETERDKDKKTGGDYEQIQLKDKDKAVYHTLGESTSKDRAEGGYEPLQKREEEGVYHTVGPEGPGEGQSEGKGGYEALKSVKADVYQTLSSDDSKKPAGEAEGGYEQLPQKDKDYEAVTVEDSPYEEVKKQTDKEKE